MDAGDVALLHFPFSHKEQAPFKKRPVLVIGTAPANHSNDAGILVAMITSSAARVIEPGQFDVPLAAAPSNLTSASICRANRLWVAEPSDFVKVIGHVTAEELAAVKSTITGAFGL